MTHNHIVITPDMQAQFFNHADFCIGTGRMGLALQKEYLDEMRLAQSLASFKHIRGHGLFSDDMAIYQPYPDENGNLVDAYCFTYLDRVMDAYIENGLTPFLELGFMPHQMASGTQTIFYWKGNTTPPQDHEKWANLIKATLAHLAERYGKEYVSTWPCEVWNEPNLPGFWENADKEKYLHLYEVSVRAVKSVLPDMKVGGPAICGGSGSQEWIRDFLTFCRDRNVPVDFVTRHAYMGQTPERHGRYLYHDMCEVSYTYEEMKTTREIIDSFPEFKGIDMHITEFNTSYNPFCPIHDTNYNAANIAGLLACLGDVARSYSYWTFGDVFEEMGVPSRPFHGGFGLIAGGLIPKPTMWTFHFFNNLKGECIYKDENIIVMKKGGGRYEGVAWNISREERKISLSLPEEGAKTLLTRSVDEETTNPLKIWHDMGEPATLTKAETLYLQQAANPKVASEQIESTCQICLRANAVIHFEIAPVKQIRDNGYDYNWYLGK